MPQFFLALCLTLGLVANGSAHVLDASRADPSNDNERYRVPDNFLLAAATSAYQSEGAWDEDALALTSAEERRIIWGEETTIEAFPHQVAVTYDDDFECGGVILQENVILTSAACLQNFATIANIRVRAGSANRTTGGQYIRANDFDIHPGWGRGYHNDVALIQLQTPLTFNNKVQPIELVAEGKSPKDGDHLTFSGWGVKQEKNRNLATMLRTANTTVVYWWQCDILYQMQYQTIDEDQFCAFGEGDYACQGDSGDPVINKDGKLVGINSRGYSCYSKSFPWVYTNLANENVRKFIDKTIKKWGKKDL